MFLPRHPNVIPDEKTNRFDTEKTHEASKKGRLSNSESTSAKGAKNKGKLVGPPAPVVRPRTKSVLPSRLPDNIGLQELRDLAGNTDYPEGKRLALLVLSMWLARQPSGTISQARRATSTVGTEICRGTKTTEQVAIERFPNESSAIVIAKAKAMLVICESHVTGTVKEYALSHVSSKCPLEAESVIAALAYAARINTQRPSTDRFNGTGSLDTWWPNFSVTAE